MPNDLSGKIIDAVRRFRERITDVPPDSETKKNPLEYEPIKDYQKPLEEILRNLERTKSIFDLNLQIGNIDGLLGITYQGSGKEIIANIHRLPDKGTIKDAVYLEKASERIFSFVNERLEAKGTYRLDYEAKLLYHLNSVAESLNELAMGYREEEKTKAWKVAGGILALLGIGAGVASAAVSPVKLNPNIGASGILVPFDNGTDFLAYADNQHLGTRGRDMEIISKANQGALDIVEISRDDAKYFNALSKDVFMPLGTYSLLLVYENNEVTEIIYLNKENKSLFVQSGLEKSIPETIDNLVGACIADKKKEGIPLTTSMGLEGIEKILVPSAESAPQPPPTKTPPPPPPPSKEGRDQGRVIPTTYVPEKTAGFGGGILSIDDGLEPRGFVSYGKNYPSGLKFSGGFEAGFNRLNASFDIGWQILYLMMGYKTENFDKVHQRDLALSPKLDIPLNWLHLLFAAGLSKQTVTTEGVGTADNSIKTEYFTGLDIKNFFAVYSKFDVDSKFDDAFFAASGYGFSADDIIKLRISESYGSDFQKYNLLTKSQAIGFAVGYSKDDSYNEGMLLIRFPNFNIHSEFYLSKFGGMPERTIDIDGRSLTIPAISGLKASGGSVICSANLPGNDNYIIVGGSLDRINGSQELKAILGFMKTIGYEK